jgi:hypothetical protein
LQKAFFSLRKKDFSCQAQILIIFTRQQELIRTLLGKAETDAAVTVSEEEDGEERVSETAGK